MVIGWLFAKPDLLLCKSLLQGSESGPNSKMVIGTAPMLEIAMTRQICHCTQCQGTYKPYVYSEQTQRLKGCNLQISTLIK